MIMDRKFNEELTEIRKQLGFKEPEKSNDYLIEMAYKWEDYEHPRIDLSQESIEKMLA